MSSGD